MPRKPDHRYTETQRLVDNYDQAPADERMAALHAHLLGKDAESSQAVIDAYALYDVDDHRGVIDAFLLSNAPASAVMEAIGVPVEVLDAYAYLFMDISVFRNRLELMSYAGAYEGTDYAKELVKATISVGYEYLMWTYGKGAEVDPRSVIKKTMVDAFYRGMAHKGNTITSATSKEAQKWWTTAIANAKTMEDIDPSVARHAENELSIALYTHDDTIPLTQAPVPIEKLLH